MLNSLEVAGGDTVNEVGMGTPVERREKKFKKMHLFGLGNVCYFTVSDAW